MGGARSVIKLGAALLLAGAAFDSASLYLPGAALAALAAATWAWAWLAARGVRVERSSGPATVIEGEPYPLHLDVAGGPVPPRGELTDPLLERPLPVRARPGRRLFQVRSELRFERRGRRPLGPARLVIRDPLGLQAREIRSTARGEVLVLPRIEPVLSADGDGSGAEELRRPEEAALQALLEAAPESEIDGLRPYREGSPASRIHWPALARLGELLERRLVAGSDSAPLVVLEAERPLDDESLDRSVRAAASLSMHLARLGGCALLLPGEGRPLEIGPDLRAWPRAHAKLALVEAGARTAISRARSGSAIFWVTANGMRGIPRPLRRLGAAGCYLVTPGPPPTGRAAFAVAGCFGQPLGSARARRRGAAMRSAA